MAKLYAGVDAVQAQKSGGRRSGLLLGGRFGFAVVKLGRPRQAVPEQARGFTIEIRAGRRTVTSMQFATIRLLALPLLRARPSLAFPATLISTANTL